MIEYKTGNIFDSKCTILVNPVNCVGVMGAGLAKQFSVRYPEMLKYYQDLCYKRIWKPGYVAFYPHELKWICLFPTKNHWKDKSELEWIDQGLADLERCAESDSIAFPKLGCGLGGLNWDDVRPLIEKYFGNWPSKVEVYV